jgi:hypothetical protein
LTTRLIFANPAVRLKAADPRGSLPPMTDAEIRAVERAAISPRTAADRRPGCDPYLRQRPGPWVAEDRNA